MHNKKYKLNYLYNYDKMANITASDTRSHNISITFPISLVYLKYRAAIPSKASSI